MARSGKRKRLFLEVLEPRVVLSQITWNAAASPTGGDWDLGSNWVGGVVPTSGDTALIQGLTSPGTVYLDSNLADSVAGLTTDSSTTLEVINGSLTVAAGSSSTLGGPVDVDSGAQLAFDASASVTLGSGQTLTDNGTLSFATGDSVSFPTAEFATTQIVVNGLLTATGTQFINPGSVANSLSQVYVGTGGEVTAADSTFGIDQLYLTNNSTLKSGDLTDNIFNSSIYAPALDVPLLAENQSFQDVDILAGSLASGQNVSLVPLGTVTTAGQRYVFPGDFTVSSGATLNVDIGASVLIRDAQQLQVDGTLNITSASSFAIEDFDDGSLSGGITVNGTIMISGTSLTRSGGTNGDDTTFLQVNAGAKATINNSAFAWDQLILDSGASTISISGNDFSALGAEGVIATGATGTDIPLDHNYWGTSDLSQIEDKILDEHVNSNLPTVNVQPFVNATEISAAPAQASEGAADQTVNLSATLSTPANVPINEGTVTFTIMNGAQVIGQATTPAPVSGGAVTAAYTLPGNTPVGNYVIDASYSGTALYLPSTDTSQFLTVTAAAVDQLVIHTEPSATATAGQAFSVQPVIYVEDQNGNLQTSDNTTIVTVSLASGSGTLQGTKSVTVTGGVATFTGLMENTAGIISLSFAGDGLTSAPSNSITVSPAAPFQLLIHTQPSPSATAGQPFATQPVVYEVDQYGNLETGDSSTMITASLASGNGTLVGTTTATLSGGVATFVGLEDNIAGPISLSFAGGGFTVGPSNNVFISAGPATQLVIQTPPYASVTAGNALTDPIVIDEEDQYGNIETGDNSTVVTASLATGGGVLIGTTTATVSAGVASFNDLEDDTAGSLSLQFSAPDLPPVVSGQSIVNPAPASGVVVNRPPSGVIAGVKFGVTVHANDPYGNLDTSYDGPVTVALASGSTGTLSGTTTMMAASGVADFTNLVDTVSGPLSLDITSGTLTPVTTSPVPVSPAAASQFVIQTQPSPSATAGASFATQPVIAEEDQYNNVVTSDSSTVLTAYLGSGAGPLAGTVTATLADGVATFTDLSDTKAGTITLQFMGGGFNSAASIPILISPAIASKLVIQTQPSATATAGEAFSVQPVIDEEDQYNNLEAGDNTTVVQASLSSGVGPLAGTSTVTLSGGVATFAGLLDTTAETITVKYSGGGFTAGPSSVVVNPAAASKLVIQTQPSSTATAGQAFAIQPVLVLEDQYNNVETLDDTTPVTVSLGSGAGPIVGATQVTVTAGVATFAGLADNRAESITLDYSGEGLTAGPSPVAISPAAASKLVIQTEASSTATAGQAFVTQPVILEEDQYGNLETGDNTTSVTASLASGIGPLVGSAPVTLTGGVATFTSLEDDKAETITIKFAGGGLTSLASTPIVVSPSTASQLVIQSQASTTAMAGHPFLNQPSVDLEDQYGNVETSDNSTSVTVTLRNGVGLLKGTTSVIVKDGVATFANLEDDTAERIDLSYSTGPITDQLSVVTVSQAAPSTLVIGTQPSPSATAGQAFSTQPVIFEKDQYGNIESGDNSTVITATLNGGAGPLQGATVTVKDGVATFTNLADDKAETLSLTFTTSNLASLPSSAVVVSQGAFAKLVVVSDPSNQVPAGSPFAITVEAQDAFGNVIPSFNGNVTLALADNPNAESLGGTLSTTAANGVATFTGLTFNKPGGSYSLTVSGGGLTTQNPPASIAPPTPAQIPTVMAETVVMFQKTNKKGKPQGKKMFSGFNIKFSTAMDPTSVILTSNYQMGAAKITKKKGKTIKSFTPVHFTASYDPSSDSVTLKVIGKNLFAKGGQINVLASPPTGVSSQLGVPLNSNDTFFAISTNAKQITLA